MTVNFRTMELDPPLTPPKASPARAGRWNLRDISDRGAFTITILALLILYGLLQNPYWVPAGDSELYTAAARNIAIGKGYTFNGQPVAIIPPGWSWMMAAVMKMTPYVFPLKLLAMGLMIGSLAMGYFIVRRFVSPGKAILVILLTAIVSHVYQATYWLISESAFCLATSATFLLAMQIAEGRRQKWRIALLLVLCVAAIGIRWAGVLGALLVVAILLKGELKPRLTMPWVVSLLVGVVCVSAFVTLRHALRGSAEQVAAASDMVTGTGEDIGAMPAAPITGSANQSAQAYQLFPTGSYADRFLNWGRWFSYLYWQPFRAAGASVILLKTATFLGWIVIGVLSVLVFMTIRRRQWLWLALGLYCGMLALGWTNVNARYYVPVAFLLTVAMFLATDELVALAGTRRPWRATVLTAFFLFIGAVGVCNAALYSVEMAIARSGRFYSRYEDGLNMSLITACQYLNAQPTPPQDGEIAVSQRYTNLNRSKASPFGLRASVLLTGKKIVTPRFKDTTAPPNSNSRAGRDLRRWLNSKGAKWYLYQPEISPWRVWHFRLGWYEQMQVGHTADKDTAGWQLYTLGADREDWIPVRLPNKFQPVTRVPGL